MADRRITFRNKKEAVRRFLVVRETEKLKKWAKTERSAFRVLISLLFDREKLICYRAAEALGIAAAIEAENDLEIVRELLRRLLWTMNDESGNTCWYAPEAIGEILFNVPALCKEFCSLLAPFLIEEPFEKGTRLAMTRIAAIKPDMTESIRKELLDSLDHSDPGIRGASFHLLRVLKIEVAEGKIRSYENDPGALDLYDYNTGELFTTTVGELASKHLT